MDGFGVVFFESLRRGWLPEVLRNVDAGLPIVDLEPSASKVVVELLPSFLGGILCVVNKPCPLCLIEQPRHLHVLLLA